MWNILEYDEVPSTNTLATGMLARGKARHGDVIVAHHQTAGRGRAAGRVWNDEDGASLLMSVVLTKIPEPAHLLQYRVALAVLYALRSIASEQNIPRETLRLKWPNDILIGGKKVCGILLEAQWNGLAMHSAIAGIGINVRQRSFPEALASSAVSLVMMGCEVAVAEIRDRILESLERELSAATIAQIVMRLTEELEWMGQITSMELEFDGERLSQVRYAGVAESGALKVFNSEGKEIFVRNGSLLFDWQNR